MSHRTVLITNVCLTGHSGTEMYVRDLARGLLQRGHTPIVYSPKLGPLAERLSAESVAVVDDLRNVGQVPDLIHGHHTMETLCALLRFPDTPAVFLCHDCDAWHDAPPKLKRVRRYIGVDQCCADRLTLTHGIPREQVRMLENPVDLRLFQQRLPLPVQPQRALVFSDYMQASSLAPVRQACAIRGIELQAVGRRLGGSCQTPEHLLRDFDLVFSKGRCAREAMAVGCAVVYCDLFGLGPMVTRSEIQSQLTLGRRIMSQPLTTQGVLRELDKYDSMDAAAVSTYLREHYSLETVHDQLLEMYEEVIAEQLCEPTECRDELREVAGMIQWWSRCREEMVVRRARRNRPSAIFGRFVKSAVDMFVAPLARACNL